MAKICDACFTTDTGFIVEASYPYSTTYEDPERLYCIDGVPTAAPARAAVAPLSTSFVAEPLSAPTDGTSLVAPTSTAASWTNLSPRSCNVFGFMDGSLTAFTSAVAGDFVRVFFTLAASDAQTSAGYAMISVPYSASSAFASVSFSACSSSLTVAPGVSVTATITANVATSGTGIILSAFNASGIFMGAAV